MSTRMNLNDNVNSVFPFTIGGVDFDLKYPTLEELEPIQELNSQRAEAVAAEDTERVAEVDKRLEEAFYQFIVPTNGTSDIQDVLKKQPFPVIKRFNDMVKEQLSV